MNYLGIDLWDKRCGIAISKENIAFPHSELARTELMWFLKKYISQENIAKIIVGLPYDLYGVEIKQLEKTQSFIKKLQSVFPQIEIIWHDERFSSFEASLGFDDHRDDIAAQCILQSYIDSVKK